MGFGKGSNTVLGSTHVVEQLSYSLFLSILTFGFDLILGSFFTFWGPNGLFLGLRKSSKSFLGSTHLVEQFSFSMFLSILIFDFYLISGTFLTFWGHNGPFLGLGSGSTTVLGSTHVVEQLSFCIFPSRDAYFTKFVDIHPGNVCSFYSVYLTNWEKLHNFILEEFTMFWKIFTPARLYL